MLKDIRFVDEDIVVKSNDLFLSIRGQLVVTNASYNVRKTLNGGKLQF